jgi:hypothetical protein
MLITYWCPRCRALHATSALRLPDSAGEPFRCLTSGAVVSPRGIPDDPDDPAYGTPRCPVCQLALKDPAAPCPECGATPG